MHPAGSTVDPEEADTAAAGNMFAAGGEEDTRIRRRILFGYWPHGQLHG